MKHNPVVPYIKNVLQNKPLGWVTTTTHRLDIYNESLAKSEFLTKFELLFQENNASLEAFQSLPTAYDYIRLGHPLSCILEWAIAKKNNLPSQSVISFSSITAPILAVLRKNLLEHKATTIVHIGPLPHSFNATLLQTVYGYRFDVHQVNSLAEISNLESKASDTSILFISQQEAVTPQVAINNSQTNIDFSLHCYPNLGSILLIHGTANENYIADIQHVRRRETIAMTPANCLQALQRFIGEPVQEEMISTTAHKDNKALVLHNINKITATSLTPLVGSSGLSIQYAIMMGLIDDALENHKGKAITFIVPPNCYGGTNDQARRVAACIDQVQIVDLPVDGDNNMVQSIDRVLTNIAQQDAIPYIIAEIPTNPRVEVPDLQKLKEVLSKVRHTQEGKVAVAPVFILDQTFCPNVQFLKEGNTFSSVKTISYASGSKFPGGGLCTAGYCVGNNHTERLMNKIATHLNLCDNEATSLQYSILASQLPAMNQRIQDAYRNTVDFVTFIKNTLPKAKINFVSDALAAQGFTPSVFSLDLPTKGATEEEKETYKRALNLKLINLMITEIPDEAKFCVSYGQLKGSYWTIPATSTQGTTKEGDKDYIVRASLSPKMDLALHKKVFLKFVEGFL